MILVKFVVFDKNNPNTSPYAVFGSYAFWHKAQFWKIYKNVHFSIDEIKLV